MSNIVSTKALLILDSPEIEINGRIFQVDDRKSNLDKLSKAITADQEHADDLAFKFLIGKDGLDEIKKMDLSFKNYQELMAILQGIVYGITAEEAKKRFLSK